MSKKTKSVKDITVKNSVPPPNTLMQGIFNNIGQFNNNSPLSNYFQLSYDNAYTPLSLNRILLTYSYSTHGVIQTVVNQPVEDGYRGGIEIESDELDAEDILRFQEYLELNKVFERCKLTQKWARLYGGAGLIINTDQDPETPLSEKAIIPGTPLNFIDADRWELTLAYVNPDKDDLPYDYYGVSVHPSRVIRVMGMEAPAFIRQRLQGWEFSCLESLIRPIQLYSKTEDMIFELIDEAKIDVMKIQGFNASFLQPGGPAKTLERLQYSNMTKNYKRALVMDADDDWMQKQLTFSGIGELLSQIRISEAAACKIPMAKLFGLSAAGFNSGEDDIENYNSLVESDIRAKAKQLLAQILPICAQHFFGFRPDIRFKFKPLRVLSAEQEENIKSQKQQRFSTQWAQGMFTAVEYAEVMKREQLCPIDTEVGRGLREPEPPPSFVDFDKPQQMVKTKAAA